MTSESSPISDLCRAVLSDRSVEQWKLATGATFVGGTSHRGYTLVVDGAIAAKSSVGDGPLILLVLGPGACWPRPARSGAEIGTVSLVALTPSIVAHVPEATLARMVTARPALAPQVLSLMELNQTHALARLASLRIRDPTRRVAASLQYLADAVASGCLLAGGRRIRLPQEVLGQASDLSRQRVNRELRRLQEMGLVRVERGAVCLLDRPGLAEISAGEPVAPAWEPAWEPATTCRLAHPECALTCRPIRGALPRARPERVRARR